MRPWDEIVSEEERRRGAAAGSGGPSSIGARPALRIVGVQCQTVGAERERVWKAIEAFPTRCGDAGRAAVDHIVSLAGAFRARGWPVIRPHVARAGQ